MTERLIGYGYTNSSGVATLDYDANGTPLDPTGYTGVGAGVVDIKAKLHDDSSLQSETYSLIDAFIRDGGITGDTKANQWYLNRNNVTINSSEEYTTITDSNGSSYSTAVITDSTSPTLNGSYLYSNPLVVEFDLISFNANCGWRFYDKTNNNTRVFPSDITANSHIKIEITGTKCNVYCDGEFVSDYDYSPSASLQVGFRIGYGETLKFKNFVVYSI